MYEVKDVSGNTIAFTTRIEDARAMCSTSFESDVTDEIANWVEKNLEPEQVQFLSKENIIKLYWESRLETDPQCGWEIIEL